MYLLELGDSYEYAGEADCVGIGGINNLDSTVLTIRDSRCQVSSYIYPIEHPYISIALRTGQGPLLTSVGSLICMRFSVKLIATYGTRRVHSGCVSRTMRSGRTYPKQGDAKTTAPRIPVVPHHGELDDCHQVQIGLGTESFLLIYTTPCVWLSRPPRTFLDDGPDIECECGPAS